MPVGAPACWSPIRSERDRVPLIAAADILACIETCGESPVGVLLSGDVGFYSGAKICGRCWRDTRVESLPGISSLAYPCTKLKTSWQDAAACGQRPRTYTRRGWRGAKPRQRPSFLTGGKTKAQDVCRAHCRMGHGLGGDLKLGRDTSPMRKSGVSLPARPRSWRSWSSRIWPYCCAGIPALFSGAFPTPAFRTTRFSGEMPP
ncbi:MAG: hypothetical protein ACLSAF_16470 [Intestinimonas sp.]